MKITRPATRFLVVGALVLAIAGVLAACGGDDDDDNSDDGVQQLQPGEIRTEKGLAVAARANELGANFGGAGGTESDDGARAEIDVGGAEPAADAAYGIGVDVARSPYYFPQAAAGGVGITVQGYGSATAAADSAVIEIYFHRDSFGIDRPIPLPEGEGSSGSSGEDFGQPAPVEPITEADVQPVIDALNAAGADSVEFVEPGYFDTFYASATLRATFGNTDGIQGAADSATSAAQNLQGVFFGGSNVYYTVSDCSALERAAMEAALEDANERGDVLAEVISASRGEIIGASNYTYSPAGDGSCSSTYYGYPFPVLDSQSGAPGPTDVEVFASLTVSYAIN